MRASAQTALYLRHSCSSSTPQSVWCLICDRKKIFLDVAILIFLLSSKVAFIVKEVMFVSESSYSPHISANVRAILK